MPASQATFANLLKTKVGIGRLSLGDANKIKWLYEKRYVAATLSVDECNSVMQGFVQGFRAFSGLERFRSDALAVHARRDLTQSARFAMEGQAAYGQSRWSALQAAEKSLKLFIEKKNQRYPTHHRLAELAEIATRHGLPAVPRHLLEAAQCDASVRYEHSDQRIEPVLAANAAAVAVAFMVTSKLSGITFRIEGAYVDPSRMHIIAANAVPPRAARPM